MVLPRNAPLILQAMFFAAGCASSGDEAKPIPRDSGIHTEASSGDASHQQCIPTTCTQAALECGAAPEELLMVGDDAEFDVAASMRLGSLEARQEIPDARPGDIEPDPARASTAAPEFMVRVGLIRPSERHQRSSDTQVPGMPLVKGLRAVPGAGIVGVSGIEGDGAALGALNETMGAGEGRCCQSGMRLSARREAVVPHPANSSAKKHAPPKRGSITLTLC